MSAARIVRFERLRQPPMNFSGDQIWWEADVATPSVFWTVHVWVPHSAANSIPGNPDEWARGELEKLVEQHSPVGKLYAHSPIELHPESEAQLTRTL